MRCAHLLFLLGLVGIVLLSAGCTVSEAADTPELSESQMGPVLTRVAQFRLERSEEHYVSIPISFAVVDDGSGDFLVSDGRLAKVIRFARDGSPVIVYGKDSSSPAFLNTWTVGAWDSTVAVADIVGQRVHTFHSRSHELTESRPYLGTLGVALAQPSPDVWIGSHYRGISREHPSGAILWNWSGDEVHIELPDEWFRYPAIEVHSGLNVVKRSEDLLVAFAALEAVVRVSLSGMVEDTLFLPVSRRRGVSQVALARNSLDTRGIVEHTSRMVLMDMDVDGNIVVVHQDAAYLSSGRLLVADMWVSLIDGSLERACVDGRLDVESIQTPNPYFRRDTLWVQTSRVSDGQARLEIAAYSVDTSGCDWLPLDTRPSWVLP